MAAQQGSWPQVGRPVALPIAVYLALHAILLLHNWAVPDVLLRGDRSGQRLENVTAFLNAPGDLDQLMLATGFPGDWLAHGLVWLAGGPLFLVLCQVALGAVSVVATVRIAQILGAAPFAASLAGLLAVVMPGGIMNPHLLVTESWYTAGFTAAIWLAGAAIQQNRRSLVIGSMLLFALAGATRPQGMVLPLAALALIWFAAPSLRRPAVIGALLALLVTPGIWLGWRLAETGEFAFGSSSFDLAYNLRNRIEKAVPGLDLATDRIGLTEFLTLAAQHPVALAKSYVVDAVNFVLNPGTNHIFGHYLELVSTPESTHYWRNAVIKGGVGGLLEALWTHKGVLAVIVLGGVLHLAIVAGALAGIVRALRDHSTVVRRFAAIVLVLALVQFATTFASGIIRWAHRAPLEPVIAAFAGLGLCWLVEVYRRWSWSRGAPGVGAARLR